jgi:hypothetical protein
MTHCNVTEMLDELRFRHAHAIAEIERARLHLTLFPIAEPA